MLKVTCATVMPFKSGDWLYVQSIKEFCTCIMQVSRSYQTKAPWICHQHPYLGHPSIFQKKCAIKSMLFSISMKKTKSPREENFFVTFGSCEKIEVKRGHLVKKWEFGQMKKILYINFSKLKYYVLLWPMVNFCLKLA